MKLISSLLIVIVFFFVSSNNLYPQEKPNSVYFELLGNGVLYSINYERFFTENLGGRIGFMYLPDLNVVIYSLRDIIIIPVLLNYYAGSGRSKLELGGGIIYASISAGNFLGFDFEAEANNSGIAGTAVIGYRYQSENGFLFRAGFSPMFSPGGFQPYGGISAGFSF